MNYKAAEIANYLIHRSIQKNKYVNNIHLQKSLFFLQAYFLLDRGEPLFEDEVEMWRLGPVVVDVYDEYKLYGSTDIVEVLTIPVFDKEKFALREVEVKNTVTDKLLTGILDELIDSLLERDSIALIDDAQAYEIWNQHREAIKKATTVRRLFVYSPEEMMKHLQADTNALARTLKVFS